MKKPYFQAVTIVTLLLLIYGVHFNGRSHNTTSTVHDLPWNLVQIEISGAWKITTGNRSITIAVIDTGVDFTNPSISQSQWINAKEIPNNSKDDDNNGYIDDWRGWDWVNHDNNPGWEEIDKINHHGTFITGILAANNESLIGVAPNTTIMALRVVDQDTLIPNPDSLASAVDYAIENGANVIVMSLDLFIGPPGFRDSIREAFNKGIPTVAIAGNSDFGNESIVLPGSFSEVITVGASNINHEKADYSNIGGELDSYAAPHVAGVIALIKSIRSDLVVDDIRYILHTTATDIGPIGWDKETGYGILNATAALELALVFSPTTSTNPKTFWIFGTGSSILLEIMSLFTLTMVYINRKRNKSH